MFSRPDRHEYLGRPYLWLWMTLAFQAGAANAGGFLACARFVSHMTGFGTQVGVSIAEFDFAIAAEMLSAPLSFLCGAMAAALLVDRPMLAGRPPKYLWVMATIVLIFGFVTVGGERGLFGDFGEPLRFQRDFALMAILCFACGMQNACFGSLTRGQIRTTHLTGILTDIGVTFVKLRYLEPRELETLRLRRMNLIRMLTFFSFSSGSAIFAVVFSQMGYAGFGMLTVLSSVLLSLTAYQQAQVQARRATTYPERPLVPSRPPQDMTRDEEIQPSSLPF